MMKFIFPIIALLGIAACTSQQVTNTLNTVNQVMQQGAPLTSDEVGAGLKEALINGISNGVLRASAIDGYLKNDSLRIPFPSDAQKVEKTLRDIGLGSEVDKFITSLNRGAEEAAKSAKPIFVDAIKAMTIQDAFAILRGDQNAATQYLRKTTEAQLVTAFTPIVEKALGSVNATKYYSDLVTRYNKIPTVQKVNPDLKEYATQKAIDGLFLLVEQEEKRIREDPVARTTDLLKRVFGAQK